MTAKKFNPSFFAMITAAAIVAVLTSTNVSSGQVEPPPATDSGPTLLKEAQAGKISAATANAARPSSKRAEDILKESFGPDAKKFDSGWVPKEKRYAKIEYYSYPIENLETLTLTEFFTLRQLAALGAFCKANANLCKTLGETADLDIKLETHGTPANAQFADPLKRKLIELGELETKVGGLGVALSKAEKDTLNGVTLVDRTGKALDALIKKVDTNYNSAAILPEKKARMQELQAELASAKQEADTLRTNIVNFDKNYRQRSISSDFHAYFSHNILGATAVKMAEVVAKKRNGKGYELQMAIAYVWSPKLEAATRAIIQGGEAVVSDIKGEKDIVDYLAGQDPRTFPPMFFYTDNEGSKWFLGASYADITEQDAEIGDDVARLGAYQNCYASLFLSMSGKESLRQAATAGKLGSTVDDPAVAKTLQAGFPRSAFAGASPKLNPTVEWELQGGKTADVRLYVVGVDAQSAKDMMKNEEELTAGAVRKFQNDEYMRGRDAALKTAVTDAQKDPASYQRGATAAQSAVKSLQDRVRPKSEVRPVVSPKDTRSDNQETYDKGKIAPGQKVTPGRPKDDF